ncbi:MAG: glycine--tRNA ligase subunit beta [Candidatus Cloacimonadaceae bacterium]|nr:glycine--tRNA ligase subunit beta [Candidatus Cloacimonadaceae bacterium]
MNFNISEQRGSKDSARRDFLLEIGVEEIPADHINSALEFIRDSFVELLHSSRLTYDSMRVGSTPRRFALIAFGVQEQQEDVLVERSGPAAKIAYDSDGKLTPAAMGFLKKNSASPEDIIVNQTDKGDFIGLKFVQAGKSSRDLITQWCESLIPRIPFPKTMIWKDPRLAFSRPIRWICALWDSSVLPLCVTGLNSDRYSYGNRYLGLETKVEISHPKDYFTLLEKVRVLADREARKAALLDGLAKVCGDSGLQVAPDERLADTVTDLVEYPFAVLAQFDPHFLSLPEKIITSTISQNQKYFSVFDSRGSLSNSFVFISNGDPAHSALIRRGNEKVVKARLSDAIWYYQEDTKHPLESYLPRLRDVVFQAKLGSVAEKNERIHKIAEYICAQLQPDQASITRVLRCAQLCKADLVTNMLGEKEFTKLQGYIGKQYALACGEDPEVAEGIYEHYQPRGSNDALPKTLCGAVVAVADKLDTVCGIIGIGMMPTGSADPFALRRAANGIVQIIVDQGWSLDFEALLAFGFANLGSGIEPDAKAAANIELFFRQRVVWLLKQMNIDYDVIDSVTHFRFSDLNDLISRCMALNKIKTQDGFIRLVIGFKRVANIISEDKDLPPPDSALFEEAMEQKLHQEFLALRGRIDALLTGYDYDAVIGDLIAFGRHIDAFFDAVLVNCEDARLKTNRHALLSGIKREFLRVADISQIVVDSDAQENK